MLLLRSKQHQQDANRLHNNKVAWDVIRIVGRKRQYTSSSSSCASRPLAFDSSIASPLTLSETYRCPATVKVAVALSGGVDSAVSALLLKKQGYQVFALHMSNWSEAEETGHCTTSEDILQVSKVTDHLQIPTHYINFEKEYWNHVFQDLLDDYLKGRTPNPDVACNREIKFKCLLDRAIKMGASYLATGHYAQLRTNPITGRTQLLKAKDTTKDQTYFLTQVSSCSLSKVLFPVGHLEKKEVRQIALQAGLPNATRKDSVGLCFVGKRKFKQFLSEYISQTPGKFIDVTTNQELQQLHDGRYYVVKKDIETNVIYVAPRDHPELYCQSVVSLEFHWIDEDGPPELLMANKQIEAEFKVRHSHNTIKGTIHLLYFPSSCVSSASSKVKVDFFTPVRSVATGQVIAAYQNEICLGGGVISYTSS